MSIDIDHVRKKTKKIFKKYVYGVLKKNNKKPTTC